MGNVEEKKVGVGDVYPATPTFFSPKITDFRESTILSGLY